MDNPHQEILRVFSLLRELLRKSAVAISGIDPWRIRLPLKAYRRADIDAAWMKAAKARAPGVGVEVGVGGGGVGGGGSGAAGGRECRYCIR